MSADTKIIRNFDALKETTTVNSTDNIIIGQKQGGRGGLIPRRIDIKAFATKFFSLSTVVALLCDFLEGAIGNVGTTVPIYNGFDNCIAQFNTLTAGTNITLDDTTTPGEIIINSTGGSSLPYKVYVATITQTGTAAPVPTVLQNTLSGTPLWIRNSIGDYIIKLTGEFTENKTTVLHNVVGFTNYLSIPTISVFWKDINNIGYQTLENGVFLDGQIATNATIEIRVYP